MVSVSVCPSASGNEMSVSPGRRFMIDLLVSSLMADGGLESALNAAITAELQVGRRVESQMDPYSLFSALLFTTAPRALVKRSVLYRK